MAMTVEEAADAVADIRPAKVKLETLVGLGLGYLTLGEATPALSGGEAQRLKLASEMGRRQGDALFVFDEPTIGLHPLDVEVLLGVLKRLVAAGATVVVIEHDLDMIANADWIIDLGPGGGSAGGEIVVAGTPEEVAASSVSVTGRYLREML
jgi:excinuclease ABC subunit A